MQITREDVLCEIIKITYRFENEGLVSVDNIAKKLHTNSYHVNKHIKMLLQEGFIVKGFRRGGYDNLFGVFYLPLKGYRTTEKVKELSIYKKIKEEEDNLFEESFYFDDKKIKGKDKGLIEVPLYSGKESQ